MYGQFRFKHDVPQFYASTVLQFFRTQCTIWNPQKSRFCETFLKPFVIDPKPYQYLDWNSRDTFRRVYLCWWEDGGPPEPVEIQHHLCAIPLHCHSSTAVAWKKKTMPCQCHYGKSSSSTRNLPRHRLFTFFHFFLIVYSWRKNHLRYNVVRFVAKKYQVMPANWKSPGGSRQSTKLMDILWPHDLEHRILRRRRIFHL